MKKALVVITLLVIASFGFAGPANADTTTAGGVSWTFTSGGSDGAGGFLVDLTIDTTNAIAGTLDSFAVQFTGATNVTIASSSLGWTTIMQGNHPAGGCNFGNANAWCTEGTAVSVPDGVISFVFDVTGLSSAPTTTHIQAFQGQGDLAISNDVGIGPPTTSTPEPASMLLLGLGLAGVPFLRRKKQ
jgi:hypothetical protein